MQKRCASRSGANRGLNVIGSSAKSAANAANKFESNPSHRMSEFERAKLEPTEDPISALDPICVGHRQLELERSVANAVAVAVGATTTTTT